jgi:hypothetical protein
MGEAMERAPSCIHLCAENMCCGSNYRKIDTVDSTGDVQKGIEVAFLTSKNVIPCVRVVAVAGFLLLLLRFWCSV